MGDAARRRFNVNAELRDVNRMNKVEEIGKHLVLSRWQTPAATLKCLVAAW